MEDNMNRRQALKWMGAIGAACVGLASGLLRPIAAWASWNTGGFMAKDLQAALKAIGAEKAAESKDITIKAPATARNGAVVSVDVQSSIRGTESIAILADSNILPLAGIFKIPASAEPWVSTRIKMRATGNVIAVVKAGGKAYIARRKVNVSVGAE